MQIELLEWADRALRPTTSTDETTGAGSEGSKLVAVKEMGELRIIERTDSPQQTQGLNTAETSECQPPYNSGSMSGYLSMACRLFPPIPRKSSEAQESKQVDEEGAPGKGQGKEKEAHHDDANAKGKVGDRNDQNDEAAKPAQTTDEQVEAEEGKVNMTALPAENEREKADE